MIPEAAALFLSLFTLGCSLGVFVLPTVAKAHLCFLGAFLGAAGIAFMGEASTIGWVLVCAATSTCLLATATPAFNENPRSGWHNWFVAVVTASLLWLLSLFLLWTIEEALAQPIEMLSMAPAILEVVGEVFDHHLWVVAILALLGSAVAWGARGESA